MDFPNSSPRNQLLRETIDTLIHMIRLHHRIVEKRIDGMGVHHSQHRMLMRLSQMEKPPTQKDLATVLDVSPACVARTLKSLSASRLIERTDGADSRCNQVSISPQGRQVVNDSLLLFRRIDEEIFRGISQEDLETLNRIMKRIQGNLFAMEQNPVNSERSE